MLARLQIPQTTSRSKPQKKIKAFLAALGVLCSQTLRLPQGSIRRDNLGMTGTVVVEP
jgi:hypothetical protein